jgi:hypothetical protein
VRTGLNLKSTTNTRIDSAAGAAWAAVGQGGYAAIGSPAIEVTVDL